VSIEARKAALDAIFEAQGEAAVYHESDGAGGFNPDAGVRVKFAAPEEFTDIGEIGMATKDRLLRVRESEVPAPKVNDEFTVRGERLRVYDRPLANRDGTAFRMKVVAA
jgi:hypothetical protein